MPLKKDFKDTVKARMERSPKFRRAVLREAIECLLAGDVETGKVMLRDYINGTIGFEELGDRTQTPPKSLMRMFGPNGNPQAKNLFDVIAPAAGRGGPLSGALKMSQRALSPVLRSALRHASTAAQTCQSAHDVRGS